MKSSNPIFRDSALENVYQLSERPMTVSGTMNKLLLLSLIMMAGAGAVYYQFSLQHYDFVHMLMIIGLVVSVVLAFIIAFKQNTAPYLAPIYAFAQGSLLSGISCFFEAAAPGIVIQAISMTFIVVFAMAFLFQIGAIRADEKFKSVILIATLAIGLFYLISILLSFFHVEIPYFSSVSTTAIVINAVIAVIAALNLIIDFDFIQKGVSTALPAMYEWYGAFGLLVTILWLYLEILRLLMRLRDR